MEPGENIMKLRGSELVGSRFGFGAIIWGELPMGLRFNPVRFAYGPVFRCNDYLTLWKLEKNSKYHF